jgi:hypothetical protein
MARTDVLLADTLPSLDRGAARLVACLQTPSPRVWTALRCFSSDFGDSYAARGSPVGAPLTLLLEPCGIHLMAVQRRFTIHGGA